MSHDDPSLPTTLNDWLAHCERLHPTAIDMTLDRVVAVRERLGLQFKVPVITVAGTNGKGSTCAMLDAIARQAGWRVGLYIKPHLVHFEERCRINGRVIDAADLLPQFAAVEAARGGVTLTYFEFTTLAILRALSCAELDLVILEVGLGGRLDAVNAIDADCVVITSIALDHMEYLGPDRESIGREKAHVMRPGKPAIVSDPVPPQSVLDHAAAVGADLWLVGRDFNHAGDRQQWGWSGRGRRYTGMAYPALRGANQLLNAAGAIAALEALRSRLPVSAQAIRNGLATVELPGRFQIVPGQPTLVLDVAHNPQSVATLALNLDAMGFYPRTLAVFGAMRDKDIPALMSAMAPLVDGWYLCDLATPRAARAAELAARLGQGPAAAVAQPGQAASEAAAQDGPAADGRHGAEPHLAGRQAEDQALDGRQPSVRTAAGHESAGRISAGRKVPVHTFAAPRPALAAALAAADPADRIVVFGSFYTVGGVLKDGLPRLTARHAG